jgi:hypothetical protein
MFSHNGNLNHCKLLHGSECDASECSVTCRGDLSHSSAAGATYVFVHAFVSLRAKDRRVYSSMSMSVRAPVRAHVCVYVNKGGVRGGGGGGGM